MAKGAYIGVSSVTRKIKKFYIGQGGVAHAVKKAYIGVDGKARLFWSGSADGNIILTAQRSSSYKFMTYKASSIHYAGSSDFSTLAETTPPSTSISDNMSIRYDSHNERYILWAQRYIYVMNKNSSTWTYIGTLSYYNTYGNIYIEQSTGDVYITYPTYHDDVTYIGIYKTVITSSGITQSFVQDFIWTAASSLIPIGLTKAGSYYWASCYTNNNTNWPIFYSSNLSTTFTYAGSFSVTELYGNTSGGSNVRTPYDGVAPVYYDDDGYYVGLLYGDSYYSNNQHIGTGCFKGTSPSELISGRILNRVTSGYYGYNPLCYLKHKIFFLEDAYMRIYYSPVTSSTTSVTFTQIGAIAQNTIAPPNYRGSIYTDGEYLYFIGYSTSYSPTRQNLVRINPDDVGNPSIITNGPFFTSPYIWNYCICTNVTKS